MILGTVEACRGAKMSLNIVEHDKADLQPEASLILCPLYRHSNI